MTEILMFYKCITSSVHQEKNRGLTRELSLWEWRHWQHKSLPTHVVDHSVRCQHFVKVMELVDSMKDENEVGK